MEDSQKLSAKVRGHDDTAWLDEILKDYVSKAEIKRVLDDVNVERPLSWDKIRATLRKEIFGELMEN